MLVACIALALALAGTAIAAPEAHYKTLTKSKVKKIAKRQANQAIAVAAPGLNVNSAKTADTATTAASATTAARATTADSATNADNAALVNGVSVEPVRIAQQESAALVFSNVLSVSGNTVEVGCLDAGNHLQFNFARGVSDPPMFFESHRPGLPEQLALAPAGAGNTQGAALAAHFGFTIREGSGRVTELDLVGFFEQNASGGTSDCFYQGTITRYG